VWERERGGPRLKGTRAATAKLANRFRKDEGTSEEKREGRKDRERQRERERSSRWVEGQERKGSEKMSEWEGRRR